MARLCQYKVLMMYGLRFSDANVKWPVDMNMDLLAFQLNSLTFALLNESFVSEKSS